MGTSTIRDLDDELKAALRVRAAQKGPVHGVGAGSSVASRSWSRVTVIQWLSSLMTEPVAEERGMLNTSTVILLGRLADPDELPAESVISCRTLGGDEASDIRTGR